MSDLPHAYVINLDRAPERFARVHAALAAQGIDATRAPAVDGRAEADALAAARGLRVQRDDLLILRNWDGRRYNALEEACFQSHMRVLDRILESGAPFALVFEDDAEFAPGFAALVRGMISAAPLWDVVKLEGSKHAGARKALLLRNFGETQLVASLAPSSGSAAYLVSRQGAEGLRRASAGRCEPYDNYLNAIRRTGLRVADCAPFPVRQAPIPSSMKGVRQKKTDGIADAIIAWQRHLRADLGKHIMRWREQPRRFAGHWTARINAPWSRVWPEDAA